MGKKGMRGRHLYNVCKTCPSRCETYISGRGVFQTDNPRYIPKEYMLNGGSGVHAYCKNFQPIERMRILFVEDVKLRI